MQQSNLSATSRQNADRHLLTILLAGLGGSIVFHAAAIAGVSHLWKPTAAIDEPMEITMVDVDKPVPAPVVPTPTPVIVKPDPKPVAFKPAPKIVTPPPAKVAVSKPAPKIVTPPPDKPIPIVKTSATLTANPAAKANKPSGKISSKPAITPKRASTPTKSVIDPAFPDDLFRSKPQPVKTNNTPIPKRAPRPKIANNDRVESGNGNNQAGLVGTPSGGGGGLAGKLSNNPNPGGSGGNAGDNGDFGKIAPSKVGAAGGGDGSGGTNQSGLVGNSSSGGRLTRGFGGGSGGGGDILTNAGGDGDFGKVAPSKIGAAGDGDGGGSGGTNQSGLVGNSSGGGKLARGFGGGSGGGSGGGNGTGSGNGNGSGNGIGGGGGDGDFGTVAQGNTWRGARGGPGIIGASGNRGGSGTSGGGDGDGGGGGGIFGLQCISRCQISGLTDLEDSDGGKDKLRIKIAIDPKGFVTSASIAKSSGNSTIDRVVINGVKQMQFSPPGKIVERVVKANILL